MYPLFLPFSFRGGFPDDVISMARLLQFKTSLFICSVRFNFFVALLDITLSAHVTPRHIIKIKIIIIIIITMITKIIIMIMILKRGGDLVVE